MNKIHTLTRFDLGLTEEEYNNFLIECWSLIQEIHNNYKDKNEKEKISAISTGETVTIKLTKENYK